MADQRRRRADDWKIDSGLTVSRRWFYEMATRLGYDPRDVMSIRMNKDEAIVVTNDYRGMEALRHRLTDEEPTNG